MNTITIVNLKSYRGSCIRVDRSTALGNPFVLHSESERNIVCERYASHFWKEVGITGSAINVAANRLANEYQKSNVTLACWCFPKRCHSETIRDWLLATVTTS